MARCAPLIVLGLLACAGVDESSGNPPAEGFDVAGSDSRAIALADRAMEAMGGRSSWDRTRFLSWHFFYPPPDGRRHVWDRWTGRLRFETPEQLTLMNIQTKEGRSWKDGAEIRDPEALRQALREGYEAWVNDSYWLLMPYKLKDSGVTLAYLGTGTTDAGRASQLLQLTFDGVGVTPQNKYQVWVDDESGLVTQWAYFPEAADVTPRFKTPWAGWTRHGDILLSGDRGQMQLTEISVFASLPDQVFSDPAPIDLESYD